MKSRTLMAMAVFLMAVMASGLGHLSHAQEGYLWLKTKEDRVVTGASFGGFSRDSLILSSGGRTFAIPLVDIQQVRVYGESSLLKGGLIGAGIGAAAGAVIGYAVQSDRGGASSGTTILLMGILGGIVGSVKSSIEDSSTVITVSAMDSDQKKKVISELIHPDQPERASQTDH